ncbi:PucR family transcriptional regulator ligand-binding domain-containing protein [Proteiniclasticum sp. SCR006]|uniref:PucR family transcriptional regulator ligand-binding domain-containing protein n=1 Tax=Proteiniclasticum aestuarii TaxID=2817862 RepID=A0A939KF27_9CLOT|nr:PucR family transcriptional regulator [Proteiniclasticum aestuarii]MBO1264027.1 PucR family transcriptional regulator ligand-binding domain-containing protein [Proteiniclasticum aestuarii]
MFVTMKNILQLEGFRNAKLVAGEKGADHIVNSAMIMEVPDIYPYVGRSNLLITTLFPIYDDEKALMELIPKLHALGVAGICIKPFRYISGIPKEMIRQGNELQFPVIELPPEANLSGLVNEILEISLKKHINVLNFRNNVHDSLMKLFLEGKEIPELLDNLAEICHSPTILLDGSSRILMKSRELTRTLFTATGSIENGTLKFAFKDKVYEAEDMILHPIRAGMRLFGYLVILKGEEARENLLVAAEEASLLIASVYYKNYAVMEKERSFQDSFIRDILQGKVTSPMETINKAKYFGWNMEFPQVIMVIRIFAHDEKVKKELYEEIIDSGYIDEIMESELKLAESKFKLVYLDDSMVLFINSIFMEKKGKGLKDLGEKLIRRISTSVHTGIGISEAVLSIEDLPGAYRQAKIAAEIGYILHSDSFVSFYQDYEMFSLIREIRDQDLLKAFTEKKLGALLEYDRVNEVGLMETLRVLIEENFNAKKASEKLYIHYNTMRHRIEKMKELGLDLENGFSTGEIVFAYHILIWQQALKNIAE